MSWTVGILIVSWLCIFSVSGATLGTSCTVNENCTATLEICTGGNCVCSDRYFVVNGVCELNSITVSLSAQSTSVVYGSDAILTATVTSTVSLNPIKWLKGSTELVIAAPKYTQTDVGSGTVTLTIHNVDFTDSGNYQVEVSNEAVKTNTSNQVLLTVIGEKPTVTLPGTITETTTTVTIDCTVSVAQSSPTITVYWLFNGQNLEISDSAKYSGGTVNTPSLTIKNIASTDAGVYHCGARNLLGSSNSSKSVTLEKPTVTLPGTITETITTVTIDCTVSVAQSSPTVTLYWLFNGQNLEISNSAKYSGGTVNTPSLTIKNIASTDAGVYLCGARNLLGSSNSSKSVTLEKPTVTVPGTITEMGTTVTINCTVSVSQDSPALTSVYWLLNGQNLEISNSAKYSGGSVSNPSLSIHNLASADAGEYHCGARNLLGSSTSSKSVTLAVPSVVTISKQPAGPVNYNSNVTFTGSYTSNLLSVTIKWQKMTGGNFLDIDITTDKYTGSSVTGTSPQLKINPVQLIDETSYRIVVSNGVGSSSSDSISLNVIGGNLSVTTGADVTGRFGGSVTIDCTVTGLDVNNIQWKRHINNNPEDISIDNQTFTGGNVDTKALTINNLTNNDSLFQYQCTASNPRGVFKSATTATVTVKYGQFDEDCSKSEPCESTKFLTCKEGKCLCMSIYYHKDHVCYLKSGIASTVISLNSMTNKFSIFWNNSSTDYELVSGYEVKWRVEGSMEDSSGQLSRTVNQYTASSNLTPGQLYIVNVISHVTVTNPADSFVVASSDEKVRLVPLPPGPILRDSNNFAYDNLIINWTAPANNTFVTKYRVSIDGATQQTSSHKPEIHFTAKVLTPGMNYNVKIVTVSGTTDNVKESSELIETIRITPTKPGPPTNVSCPESPLDVSLEISWKAPTNPNGRIHQYLIYIKEEPRTILTLSDETMEKIEGLYPEQTYTFTVQTINDAAESIRVSDRSSPVACNTKAGVSSPPTKLVLDGIQSRGFHVEFDAPENVSGVLAGYKILVLQDQICIQQIQVVAGHCAKCMNTSSCPAPITYSVTNISLPVSYNVTGLNPYTQYLVKVAAVNGVGEGHIVNGTATTEEEIPKKPSGITSDDIQPKQMTLSWSLQEPSPGNTTFTIDVYEATDDTGGTFNKYNSININGFDNKLVQVTGLEEYWPYRFKVNAATKKGNMTSDFSSIFRTLQAAPGKVVGLTVQRKGEDYQTANVSWRLPDLRQHNGVLIDYLFRTNKTGTMETERIPVSLSQPKVERNLSVVPETIYIIEVLLENNMSMYSEISRQSYKAPTGPPPVSNITPVKTKPGEHKPTLHTITIDINTEYFNNKVNGKQVLFGIAVCAVLKCDDMALITYPQDWETLRNWYSAKKLGFPMYRVTNDTFMDNIKAADTSSRSKRSNNEASGFEFTIGEDQSCFSYGESFFCNGPLDPGSQYKVILFACTSGGCTWSQTSESFVTKEKIVAEPFPLALVIGVCLAVVVVFIVVGVVIVIVRRRNSLGKANRYTEKVPNTTSLDEPVPKNIPRKRPIKLKELSDKVTEKHKDSNLHFAREYEDLKALSPKHPAETSELDNNKLKNRYVNILPFDHSRVKLMLTEDDDPSTDFINANYLPGYKSQREYIATQGPIPGTIDDFWRMIWEQNVSIIVMLTLCKEEGRVKCEMYWPENIHEPKQYGDLVVETVSNSTVNFYEFRIFKIKLGDTTRSVKHFHFLQWKDFSANVQNDVMIDFIKNVRNHIRPPDMNGPVVVHCSAGVGRTGTYCALDHLFQFVDEHDLDESIDIFDLVMNLRERRMFMVQTEQQYVFIHDCVRDYVERKKKELQGNLLYENVNRGFVADDEPVEESLYQNYSNQRTDL